MDKKGEMFNFKAITKSVSGAAVIGGIFLIALGAISDYPSLVLSRSQGLIPVSSEWLFL